MRELAKSMISLSWAVGLASARGMASLFDRDRRKQFFSDSEQMLRRTTDVTVDMLGRDLRETFRFGDDFQRRAIDAGLATAASLSPKKTAKHSTPHALHPKVDPEHAG
jgi:hypothetical protein